jgi:polyisoprenoid-binding protein YceI
MNATRTIAGIDLPAAGTWQIDPGHAEIGFVGRHFGLTKVRGRFTGIEGTVTIADDIADSEVYATIDMTTVNSGDPTRDEHLRSADLFDVAEHPTATFRSTNLCVDGATATMTGELTIKGVAKSVALDVEYLGHATDPWNNERTVFSAHTTINREDWGLTWNMVLEAGGLLVSKEIRIELELELIHQP